jgi:hypothetical protein
VENFGFLFIPSNNQKDSETPCKVAVANDQDFANRSLNERNGADLRVGNPQTISTSISPAETESPIVIPT